MRPLIVHAAQIPISENSGMGRVAWHWQRECERRGYRFIHIGPEQVGSLPHPSLFPFAAYRAYKKLKQPAALFLIHEPAAGIFVRRASPIVVFSHGVERRGWQLALKGQDGTSGKIRWRTRMLFPIWRLREGDLGLKKAERLLLINSEDAAFVEQYYRREATEIHLFKNGVYPSDLTELNQPQPITILFLGSWLERKGIQTLIEAAQILDQQSLRLNWLLAGTGADRHEVLRHWPESLHSRLEILPSFSPDSEASLFARSNIFVLPSFFEGQPLALLQAMESGRCCITTDCCGQHDIIRHGINGYLHEPGDAQQLAALIAQCAKDEALRKYLGGNAKQTMKGRSWEAVSVEVVNFIEEILPRSASMQVV
jgi:glycosyltransferase involved in cell wall biosynthesis